MKMDFYQIFGIVIVLIFGVMLYPAIVSIISSGATYGTESEYLSITANTAKALSFTPVFSWTSLYRDNVSTSSNLVAGNIDDSLAKSFSTNGAVSFDTDNNLTINCEYDGDEDINFSLGGYPIGSMGMLDTCPYTFTSIDGAYIGDPSTILLMESSGSTLMEQGHNDTLALINDTLYVYFYTTKQNLTIAGDDSLHLNISIDNPNLDLTEITFNGFNVVNITDDVIITGMQPNYLLYTNGSQRLKLLDLNGTAFEGSNFTNVSWSYEYHIYESNFTNGTLTYDRWSAYPSVNYSVSTTTISANHSGIYYATYIFGTAIDNQNLILMSLVPILFIIGLIYIGYLKFIEMK